MGASPFLKWAGGKTQLLDRILPRLPDRIRTYYEPFIGGGAVFFALAREGRVREAVLGDMNHELIATYRCVRDDPTLLIEALEALQPDATDSERFYEIRAQDPAQLDDVARAARFIFLNKTCFNGLYRVNRSGQFNVPFGRYKRPKVVDPEGLHAASRALARADLVVRDFEQTVARAGRGDAVYFDPPYVPVSTTACFTSYHRSPFGKTEHERLTMVYRACVRRGAVALLSNSDTELTRELYRGLDVETVSAQRAINRDATRRGPVNEVLVVGVGSSAHQSLRTVDADEADARRRRAS